MTKQIEEMNITTGDFVYGAVGTKVPATNLKPMGNVARVVPAKKMLKSNFDFTTETGAPAWDFTDIGYFMQVEMRDSDGSIVELNEAGCIPSSVDVDDCTLYLEFPDEIRQRFLQEPELGNPKNFRAYVMIEDIALANFNEIVADFGIDATVGGHLLTIDLGELIHYFGYYKGFNVRWYVVPTEARDPTKFKIHEPTHTVFDVMTHVYRVYREEEIDIHGLTLPFAWTTRYNGRIGFEVTKSGSQKVSEERLETLIVIVGNKTIKKEINREWHKDPATLDKDLAMVFTNIYDYILANVSTTKDDDGTVIDIMPPKEGSAHEWLENVCKINGHPFEDWVRGVQDVNARDATRAKIQEAMQIQTGLNDPNNFK